MTLIKIRIWLLELVHRHRPAAARSRRRLAPNAIQQLEDRVLLAAAVQQTLIDFEDLSSLESIANLQQSNQSYWTGAYGATGAFSVVGSQSPQAYTGSTAASFGTSAGRLARNDGQPFSLKSLDVSTLAANQNNASLIFSGTKADGTRLTQGAFADGLSARRQDFAGFDELISVDWTLNSGSSGVQLDNILVTSVSTSESNPAPNISAQTFSLNENSINGTIVGQLAATGATSFQIVAGNSSDAFTISSAGVLTVSNAAAIDFEYRTQFQLAIKAIKSQSYYYNAWDAAVITVNVRDILNDRTILNPAVDGERSGSNVTTDNQLITVFGATIGLMEFSLAGIDRMQIYDTSLSVYIDPSGDLNLFRVYAYAGDGVLSATDPTGGGVLVASFRPREFGWNNVSLSRSALATLIPQLTSGYLGLALNSDPYIDPKIRSNEHLTGGPRLSLGLRPNSAPIVNESTFTIAENSSSFSGSSQLTANDPDVGDTRTWSLVASTLPEAFRVDATGRIFVNQLSLLDYEKTNQVRLTVRATDNGLIPGSNDGVIVINILDVNEVPEIADQTLTVTHEVRPRLYLGRVRASDPESSGLTYSLSNSSSSSFFSVDPAGLIRWTDRLINVSSGQRLASSYSIFVTAKDESGLGSQARVTIDLTQTYTAPNVAAIAPITLPEHPAIGTFIRQVMATDPDPGATLTYSIADTNSPFSVHPGTGRITVKDSNKLDFEQWSWYGASTFYVAVSDGVFLVRTPFQVTLIDQNDAPTLVEATVSVIEFSPVGTLVHTLIATDPDRTPQTMQYAIVSGNIGGVFALDAVTGRLTVSNADRLNGMTRPSYRLVVRVTDAGTPALSDTGIIMVDVVVPAELTVRQYSEAGTLVGIVRTDEVPETNRSYTIVSGNIGDAFSISPQGMVTVANPAVISFLDQAQYRLAVRVTSGSVTKTVITLVNVIVDNPRWLSVPVTGYGESRTAPDVNGVRQWQPPTQPIVQTVQGGPGEQSRVTLRFTSSQYLSSTSPLTVSLRVIGTTQNEVDDTSIPIDIYVVPRISNSSQSELNVLEFSNGLRVGRLMLKSGDLSENRIHVIQLDNDAFQNFRDSSYNNRILTLSFRNDANSNAVRLVAPNDTAATESAKPHLYAVAPGPEPTDFLYVDPANSDFPAVFSYSWSGPVSQSSSLNLTASRYWTVGNYSTFLKILGQRTDGSWWSAYANPGDRISPYESRFSMPVPILPETGVGLASTNWGGTFAARDESGNWWLARNAYFSYADKWHIAGNWSPDVNWSDVQVADFDGDGSDDIAGRDPLTGQWTVSRSVFPANSSYNGDHTLTTSIWGSWPVTTDWTHIVTGDFSGDGRADLLAQASTGEWWLSRSTGSGFAAAVLFGTWDASDPVVEVLSGDLNGDLRDDLIARTVSGTWLSGTTTFSGLDTRVPGHWVDPDGWDQSVLVRYSWWENSSELVVASRNRRTNEIWILDPDQGITRIRNLGAQGGTPMQRLGAPPVDDQPVSVPAPTPQGPLLNPVRLPQSSFEETPTVGTPVTIANNTMPIGGAVGITKTLTPPTFRGAAYSYSRSISSGNTLLADNDVFVRVGPNWVYQATLAPDIVDYWQISSLAMDENFVAIGDIYRGEVYVFERTGNLWAQTATLRNDTSLGGQNWTGFGRTLALQGNKLLVADTARALIIVYQRTADGWQRQTDLQVPELVNFSRPMFALDGDRLALGSASSYDSPFVLVFEKRGNVWIRTATIRQSSPNYLYSGLTLSGNTLAIQGSNAAYIYEYSGSGWLWTGTLSNGGTSPTRPATIVGDRLVTYNYRFGVNSVTQLYQRSATSWILMQEWTNATPISYDGRTLVLQTPGYYSRGPLTVVTLAAPLRPVLTTQTFTIPERLGAGQTVGTMLISNAGAADRTVYSIIWGNAEDAFRIDATTGRISVKRPERLNFETSPVFSLRITAVRDRLTATATATVQLQDIDDSPIRLVDDGDTDFAISAGSLARSGFQSDSRMFRSGTGSGQATWTFPGLTLGTYRVLTTWRNASSKATNSPFTIRDAQQILATVEVNQRLAPTGIEFNRVQWQVLGEFTIIGGELSVLLTNLADGEVTADAILIERISLLSLTPTISVRWSDEIRQSGSTLDFGTVDFGEQAERALVITNTGSADLTLQPVTPPVGFTVVTNLLAGQQLAPGESATLVLQYSASELAARSGELKVLSDDLNLPEFRINVSASRPELILGEAAIFVDGIEVIRGSGIVDFGESLFDMTKTKTITVLNRGSMPLFLGNPQLIYNYWAPSPNNSPGFALAQLSQGTLAPGESATFTVRFLANLPGSVTRRISIPVSGFPSDGDVFFMVRGNALSPEIDLQLEGTPVNSGIQFGTTSPGAGIERTLVIRNLGMAPLVLQPASVTGDFEILNNVAAGQEVSPGSEVMLTVRFKATGTSQSSGQLTIRSNDFDESVLSYSLYATLQAPEITVTFRDPNNYYSEINIGDGGTYEWGQFSLENTNVNRILTIRNVGSQDLILQPISLPAGFSLLSENLTPEQILAPGASTALVIHLSTSAAGRRSGELSFGTNDIDESPFNFQMRAKVGTVIDITMAVDGVPASEYSTVAFGTLTYGTSVTKTFTVTNRGDVPVTLQPATVSNGFTLVTNVTANRILGAGESATFSVRYDAVTVSEANGYLYLPTNHLNEGTFGLYLTGSTKYGGSPSVTVNGAPLTNGGVADFGRVGLGITSTRTLVLSNPTSEAVLVRPYSGNSRLRILDNPGSYFLIPPGGSATIKVQMDADIPGSQSLWMYLYGQSGSYFSIKATITALALGEIDVSVSGSPVANQGTYDLGRVSIGNSIIRTITVRNTGTNLLRLMPAFAGAGGNNSGLYPRILSNFNPGQAVAVGGTASISVEFPSSIVGGYQWYITIRNSDSDESNYVIRFTHSVLADAPEIEVVSEGTLLLDNTGILDFGATYIGRPSITKTITVSNIGFQNLIVQPITVPDGFTIVQNFAVNQVIAPGQSRDLMIRMEADTLASRSGQIAFVTNDADERPFDFHVTGKVIDPPSGWQFTIDNSDSGFTSVGLWGVLSSGSYGTGQHYTAKGTGADKATWTFDGLASGTYEVLTTWSRIGAPATNARYQLSGAGSLIRSETVSQKTNPAGPVLDGISWASLGDVQVLDGRLVIELSDLANGLVLADAVRIRRLS